MLTLTDEQTAIVRADLAPGETLKVAAFAGTGKTATLVAYTEARPQTRFLYVAFNKSVQLEALDRFPRNVTAKTAHALAFGTHGHPHKHRLVAGFKANTVKDALALPRFEDAQFTIATLSNYLVSADAAVARRHVPHPAAAFYDRAGLPLPDLVAAANRLGRLMCDGTDERIGMLHDGYLKRYQLSNPVLPYDCILLDEAQDVNPVISAFVMAQARRKSAGRPAAILLVGDSHQQIYSFRGAKDTLQKIETSRTLCLTQSFRFDTNIARAANLVLGTFKREKRKIEGTPLRRALKPKWDPRRYTVIARSNAGVFDQAARLHRTLAIGFVGGVHGYRLDTLKDVYRLFAGDRRRVGDPYLQGFEHYEALKAYAGRVEDFELLGACKVVAKYRAAVPGLVDTLSATAVAADAADVVLTTAHKAKGLEWGNVLLADDFPRLLKDGAPIDAARLESDEFNLVYVAITRAIHNLRFQKPSSIADFIRVARQPAKRRAKGA